MGVTLDAKQGLSVNMTAKQNINVEVNTNKVSTSYFNDAEISGSNLLLKANGATKKTLTLPSGGGSGTGTGLTTEQSTAISKVGTDTLTTTAQTLSGAINELDTGKLDAPTGGTTGQVLSKTADGTQWIDAPSGGSGESYALPIASTSTLGGVKVDGSSITVVSDGTISAAINNDTVENVVNDYMATHEGSKIEYSNTNVVRTVSSLLDDSILKQEYLGGYIEIQPDSWDGSIISTDSTTKTWGFPVSLTLSEQVRLRNLVFPGDSKNIMYIRFPLGFAYRGYRNIDETTGLAKNIGERFTGQNKSLKALFKNISEAGGGLAPEYWCPPPYWVTSGTYHGSNKLSAGGTYSQDTPLASIITSDPDQYAAQIEAFTDAIVDDLEYLHQNIAPVRMFGLQNEPGNATMNYGACSYGKVTYNAVLSVLYPKIQASTILSEYDGEENEVKLLVASTDEDAPFDGVGSDFITNHADWIWGYTHHSMRKASGESGDLGAEWYKTDDYATNVKGSRDNVFINEYEYFTTTYGTDDFRCSNNMLRLINESVYGGAKVLHPVIHVCKPFGQTLAATNTKGYCLFETNLKGSYGQDIDADANTYALSKGCFATNKTMYNSWAMFGENLPVGAYLVGDYTSTIDNAGWCAYKFGGKLYLFMANNSADDVSISLTFNYEKIFDGKVYSMSYCGGKMRRKSGKTIEFVIPSYSGQCWIETMPNILDKYANTKYVTGVIDDSGVFSDSSTDAISKDYFEATGAYVYAYSSVYVATSRIYEFDSNYEFIKRTTNNQNTLLEVDSNTKYVKYGVKIDDTTKPNLNTIFESPIYNPVTLSYIEAGLSTSDGTVQTATGKMATDFIPITNTTANMKSVKGFNLRFYDSSKTFISATTSLATTYTSDYPENTAYVRCVFGIAPADNTMLYVDGTWYRMVQTV